MFPEGGAHIPFVLRPSSSTMRARWNAKKAAGDEGSTELAGDLGLDEQQCSETLSAIDLFRAGVIEGQATNLSLTESDCELEAPVDVDAQQSLMVAKPKVKPQNTVVICDDGDTGATSSGSHSTESAFNRATLDEDRMRSTDKKQFRYPWERGPMKRIFGDTSLIKKPKLSVQPSSLNSLKIAVSFDSLAKATAFIDEVPVQPSTAFFVGVVHSSADIDHKEEKAKKRVAVVDKWWGLISQNLSASLIGRKVIDESSVDVHDDYGRELLDACFGLKSPDTLRKRFLSMKAYFDWCESEAEQTALPLREVQAWHYIRHLKSIGAPATKATSFMEAVRFCWYVIGMDGGDEIQSSLRAKGLSSQLFITKRPWRPADLLTIKEVMQLHDFLESDDAHLIDRVMVGHLLHLLYVRARWSDLHAVRNGVVDVHHTFFELETQVHKGAKGADSKSRLLPLVCPCIGVNGKDWVARYLALREKSGLEMPGNQDVCMLPAPSGSDVQPWTSRPLSSEEGAQFIRKVLGAPKTTERRLSTHSLKSTAISWTSKFGLNFEARALLARHSSAVANPTALYSRDLLSPVMRSFVHLLSQIQGGQFAPDATRSGMLTPNPATPAVPGTPVGHGVQLRVDEHEDDKGAYGPEVVPCKTSDEEVHSVNEDVESVGMVSGVDSKHPSDVGDSPFVKVTDDDVVSSTSESNADDSSSSDGEERIVDIYKHYGREEPLQFDVFINNTSLVLHCVGAAGRFRCGRVVTKTYSRVQELNGIRCTRCFDV